MSPWVLVGVFAAGLLIGMLLAFLVAVIYTVEHPSPAAPPENWRH